jgi:hypothetical protein
MTADPIQTRGERNNNPGNIDYSPKVGWRGQLGVELVPDGETFHPRFARFGEAVYGIRALAKLLISYIRVDHCTTVEAIVRRWAPPSDGNDDGAYVADVCQRTGFASEQSLTPDAETLGRLVEAIIHHENGRCLYAPATIAQAVDMALGTA